MTSIDPIIINDSPFSVVSLNEMAIPTTNYYKYTVPNGIIQGTLTNINGILSGFGSHNYLDILTTFKNNSQPYEIKFKVTTGSDVTNSQIILGDIEHSGGWVVLTIWMEEGKFHLFMSSDNVGTHDVQANTTYYIKVIDDGNTTKLYYSLDDVTYTEDISTATRVGSSVHFVVGTAQNSYYWRGSIDLKETYIKINDNIWWRGLQLEKGTSENYDLYTESYAYKTYAKEETYTESVYGDDIWYPASKGPSASSAEMVCYCKNSIYVYGVSNGTNYLNSLSSSDSIATGIWSKNIHNSLTMYNPCCVDGNYVYCVNSTKNGIVYSPTNATSMSAIETDFDFSNYTINFLKTPSVGGSLVCGFTSSSDSSTQYLMKGEFTLGGGITWDSDHKKTVFGAIKGLNHGNGKYIAINNFTSSRRYLLYATDSAHLTWITRPLPSQFPTATIVGAEYLNGVYYFLHSDGVISCTDDGITWKIKKPLSTALPSNWDGLVIFGSNLVAIHRNGYVMYVNPNTPETVEKSVYHYGGYYNPIINLPKQY